MDDNPANPASPPDDGQPENHKSANPKRSWGWGLLGGGCLTTLIAGGTIASSSVLLMGDLMSGGAVPGHGQDEMARSSVNLAVAPVFLILGITAAVVGLVLLAWKTSKKNESN